MPFESMLVWTEVDSWDPDGVVVDPEVDPVVVPPVDPVVVPADPVDGAVVDAYTGVFAVSTTLFDVVSAVESVYAEHVVSCGAAESFNPASFCLTSVP